MKINENRFSAQIATVFINWPLFWLLSGVKWDEKECMQLYVNRKKPIIYFQSHFNLSSCVGWFLFFLSEWICHKSATFNQIVYSFFFLVGDIARVSETMNLIKSQIHFHPCCYLFLLFIFCGFCWNNISRLYRLPIFFSRSWAPSFASLPLRFGSSSVENYTTSPPEIQYQNHQFPTDLD